MTGYLICPAPNCAHRVTRVSRPAAINDMTNHLIQEHDLPEMSASNQAQFLQPITSQPAA
ncbi:hypothetical protein [Streptomyces cinereoruber]|uniref:hypothetical protein n=1 Tax=Streptomyces cinereoruber TaxID=67260 RepID=UPI00363AC44B